MPINYQFRLKDPNQEKSSIRFQFYRGGKRFVYGTGLVIQTILWNENDQRPLVAIKRPSPEEKKENKRRKGIIEKQSKLYPTIKEDIVNIHNSLNNIEKHASKFIALQSEQNQKLDFDKLKDYLNKNWKGIVQKEGKKIIYDYQLLNRIERFIKGIKSAKILKPDGNRYTIGTIKNYEGLKNKFELFQDDARIHFEITDIDGKLHDRFVEYLNKNDISLNTRGRLMKNFKVVIRQWLQEIRDEDYKRAKRGEAQILEEKDYIRIKENLSYFKSIQEPSEQVYLTKEEVKKIESVDLSEYDKAYEVSRDIFLIGIYTAQRYSDYSRITKDLIKKRTHNNKTVKILELVQKKTGTKVSIPIHAKCDKILKKYKYTLPKTYEQKVNLYIKEVCKEAKIDEKVSINKLEKGNRVLKKVPKYKLITTHSARRTGCSLMYLAKIPTIAIRQISGHKTEKDFLKYIKVTGEENAKMLSMHSYFNDVMKVG